MAWITEEQMEEYIELGFTCKDCIFRNDCEDDEICMDFIKVGASEEDND